MALTALTGGRLSGFRHSPRRGCGAGEVERGLAVCGSGVGASVCANKIPGVRAGLVHDHFSARQGVEDDHMNISAWVAGRCGPAVAWDLVQTFLAAEFSQAERHLRRLGKVASLEAQQMKTENASEERPMTDEQIDQLSINTIRTLSIDAVQQAKSGHPGTPMALAPLVYTIWNRVMRFDPQDPIWPNRDRFVLSNGHASMLLWSVLHLTRTQAVNAEYETLGQPSVTLDDIRRFRQLDSKAPGHPEYHWVSGVETTTGPLGQGVATSVGMAIGAEVARQPLQPARLRYLRLQHLCRLRRWLHDGGRRVGGGVAGRPPGSRQPLLDLRQQPHHHRREHENRLHGGRRGPVPRLWLERLAGRRRQRHRPHRARPARYSARRKAAPPSSSWTATSATARRISRTPPRPMASRSAKRRSASPSAPMDGPKTRSSSCPTASTSTSQPESARAARRRGDSGRSSSRRTATKYPELAAEIDQMQRRELPAGWDRNLPVFPADPKGIAGRDASGKVLNVLAQNIPWFLGGSADLGPSNKTTLKYEGAGDFQAD